MPDKEIYQALAAISARPEPYACYTAKELWTDPHVAARMLEFHLNPDSDLASRKPEFIDRSVAWMKTRFGIGSGTRMADFGCGPGLYTSRLAKLGAKVTGLDFSRNSLDYARRQAEADRLTIDYVEADYLAYKGEPDSCDLVSLIYCDLCPLSPGQRKILLGTIRDMLAPGGRLLLDVWTRKYYETRREEAEYGHRLMNGFWSPSDYHAFHHCFLYDEEGIILDKYTILEPERTRTVYNWLKCYAPGELEEELRAAGLAVEDAYANVAGEPLRADSATMAVVARRAD